MAPLSKLVQYSQLLSILLLLVATVTPQHVAAAAHELQGRPRQGMMGRPGCRDKCGGMSIPFPFGMDKPGCFLPGFEVTCNTSFTPPRAFLAYNHNDPPYQAIYRCKFGTDTSGCKYTYQPVELFGISLETNEVRVYGGVTSRCFTSEAAGLTKGQYMELDRAGPFLLSPRDDLVGVGWNVKSSMSYQIKPYPDLLSCTSNDPFRVTAPTGSCSGLGCCRVPLPPPWPTMPVIETAVILEEAVAGDNTFWKYNPCSYGMVVEGSWYNFTAEDMAGYEVLSKKLTRGFPLVLDFAIRNGSCQRDGCPSGNSSCADAAYDSEGYVCKCKEHYHGNPYIADGCQAPRGERSSSLPSPSSTKLPGRGPVAAEDGAARGGRRCRRSGGGRCRRRRRSRAGRPPSPTQWWRSLPPPRTEPHGEAAVADAAVEVVAAAEHGAAREAIVTDAAGEVVSAAEHGPRGEAAAAEHEAALEDAQRAAEHAAEHAPEDRRPARIREGHRSRARSRESVVDEGGQTGQGLPLSTSSGWESQVVEKMELPALSMCAIEQHERGDESDHLPSLLGGQGAYGRQSLKWSDGAWWTA